MKITIENTPKFVEINGLPTRIWEGHTESGIKVHCFITRIACDIDADRTEFDAELQQQKPLSEELEVYPLRMII